MRGAPRAGREEDRVDAERRLSSWREGTWGIPEKSILEPILFKILINNLGIKEWSMLMKSADGQKQGGSVNTGEDGDIMQRNCAIFGTRITKIAQNAGVKVHLSLPKETSAH